MPGEFGVALITGKPLAAAFELDRDDVAVASTMRASGLFIDIDANDVHTVNFHLSKSILVTSRPPPRADQHKDRGDHKTGDHENESGVERPRALAQAADNRRAEKSADARGAIDKADGRRRGRSGQERGGYRPKRW